MKQRKGKIKLTPVLQKKKKKVVHSLFSERYVISCKRLLVIITYYAFRNL